MKKSLRPQQAAPVQRETTATSTSTGVGLVACTYQEYLGVPQPPFAGDDAE